MSAGAFLEMARAAAAHAKVAEEGTDGPDALSLRNVAFAEPLAIEDTTTVHLSLTQEGDGDFSYEIYTDGASGTIVHSYGRVSAAQRNRVTVDLPAWRSQCTSVVSISEYNELVSTYGIEAGGAACGIESISFGLDSEGVEFMVAEIAAASGTENAGCDLHLGGMESAFEIASVLPHYRANVSHPGIPKDQTAAHAGRDSSDEAAAGEGCHRCEGFECAQSFPSSSQRFDIHADASGSRTSHASKALTTNDNPHRQRPRQKLSLPA